MRTLNTLLGILTLLAPVFAQEEETKQEQQGPWTFRGRAIDETGKPIEGACVSFGSELEMTSQGVLDDPLVQTDAQGRFSLEVSLPDGLIARAMVRTMITAPGRASAILNPSIMPGYFRANREQRTIEFDRIVLPPAVTLRGRIRRANGRPLAGAVVTATDVLTSFVPRGSWGVTNTFYTSVAISNDRGAFTLPGCFATGAALTITTEGFFTANVAFTTPRDPLLIEMQESGVVEGTVLGLDGKPCEAWIHTIYEVASPARSVPTVTGGTGKFVITLARPHRFRLQAAPQTFTPFPKTARSAVLSGPTRDVVLRLAHEEVVNPLVVEAIAGRTGQPIDDARAAALWVDPSMWESSKSFVEIQFDAKAIDAVAGGLIKLPGPAADEPEGGVIIIKAKGYSPRTIEDVTWSSTKPPRIEVRLEPEAALSGIVIDRDGNPVRGAMVMIGRNLDDYDSWMPLDLLMISEDGGRVTNAKGEYHIDGLKAGPLQVRAYLRGSPCTSTTTALLRNGKNTAIRPLMLQESNTLTGKVTGAPIGARWHLRATLELPGMFGSYNPMGKFVVTRSDDVDFDGNFKLRGIAPGTHKLELVMPQLEGRAPDIEIDLGIHEFTDHDKKQDFDLSGKMPALIEGRVELTGAPYRPERMAVVAVQQQNLNTWGWSARDAVATVSTEGEYRLPVLDGAYALRLVDLATKIILYQSESLVDCEAGKSYRENLKLELSRVRITLVPDKTGGEVALSMLEVIVEHPEIETGVEAAFTSGFIQTTDMGVQLADGRKEITLFLPPLETTFRLRSEFHNLINRAGMWEQGKPLREQKFTPIAGTGNRLTIQVPAPQKVGKGTPPEK